MVSTARVAHFNWSIGDFDKEAGVATLSRLFAEWADQPILPSARISRPPTAGHIVSDGTTFRFEV